MFQINLRTSEKSLVMVMSILGGCINILALLQTTLSQTFSIVSSSSAQVSYSETYTASIDRAA
jgi:hypothetical protein